jgi:microcystin-dependent protein
MATVTKGRTFVSGETVTPAKLNNVVDLATVTDIQTADIADGQVTDAKLATGIDASKLTTGTLPIARIADGAVTAAKLTSGVETPAGAVMAFAMNSVPAGWLAANGSEYTKTGAYAALFAAIGTTYGETNGSGGAGSSHFRVPDLRGYFIRGFGTNAFTGVNSGNFGERVADMIKDHTHAYNLGANTNVQSGAAFGVQASNTSGASVATSTVLPPNNGGNETRPANIAMFYCIKF